MTFALVLVYPWLHASNFPGATITDLDQLDKYFDDETVGTTACVFYDPKGVASWSWLFAEVNYSEETFSTDYALELFKVVVTDNYGATVIEHSMSKRERQSGAPQWEVELNAALKMETKFNMLQSQVGMETVRFVGVDRVSDRHFHAVVCPGEVRPAFLGTFIASLNVTVSSCTDYLAAKTYCENIILCNECTTCPM